MKSRDRRFSVFDRQERIVGFHQEKLAGAHGVVVGAGGIGGEIGEGLVRKGIGKLTFVEHDLTDETNLNRQFYFRRDVGKPKAWRIVKNLKAHCPGRTTLTGYKLRFQDTLALGMNFSDANFFVCGVDNGEARVAVSEHFRSINIPGVFVAVSLEAEAGYVFIQQRGEACFGCLFPRNPYGRPAPCRTPASKDILKVVGGVALYGIDSLLMDRNRSWNYRRIHLAGFMPDDLQMVGRHPNCPLCRE